MANLFPGNATVDVGFMVDEGLKIYSHQIIERLISDGVT